MIVFCEECGRKYRLRDEDFSSSEITFRCETCGHQIVVKISDQRSRHENDKAGE